jgi:glutathione S-transferase
LYGAAHSTCTRRVMVVLEEKGVPYKLIPVNLGKGEHATPEFRATKQPFGKVPVLDDDGFLIYESRAICKYIAKRWAGQGTKLIPDDNDARAYGMFEQVTIIWKATRLKKEADGKVEGMRD